MYSIGKYLSNISPLKLAIPDFVVIYNIFFLKTKIHISTVSTYFNTKKLNQKIFYVEMLKKRIQALEPVWAPFFPHH